MQMHVIVVLCCSLYTHSILKNNFNWRHTTCNTYLKEVSTTNFMYNFLTRAYSPNSTTTSYRKK